MGDGWIVPRQGNAMPHQIKIHDPAGACGASSRSCIVAPVVEKQREYALIDLVALFAQLRNRRAVNALCGIRGAHGPVLDLDSSQQIDAFFMSAAKAHD